MKIMTERIPAQVIPAHDVTTKLYRFEELDEQIREKMLDDHGRFESDCHSDEWRDTLRELEKLFNVKCDDWSVDAWTHDYRLRKDSYTSLENAAEEKDDPDYGYLALKGNRAMGKCWTKWGDDVTDGKYYSGTFHGTPGKDCHYAHRNSKVLFVGLHDGSCPLTGVCYDNDALDPLWDMMEGKHVKDGTTIADIIDKCFEALFDAWEREIRYGYSEEAFRESGDYSEWYDEDGNPVDVPEEAVA